MSTAPVAWRGYRLLRQGGLCALRYHGMPKGVEADFFLCRELQTGYLAGITGEYGPPAVYLVDEGEAEAFDRTFPPREREKRPGQLF